MNYLYANERHPDGRYIVFAVPGTENWEIEEGKARQCARRRHLTLAGGSTTKLDDTMAVIKVRAGTKPYYLKADGRLRKPILAWDECEIVDGQVENLKENDPDFDEVYGGMSDDKIRETIYQDQDFWTDEWIFFKDGLGEVMANLKRYSGYWAIRGREMGWRKLEGGKLAKCKNGHELLDAILPKTDCTIRVYRHKKGLELIVSHHDAPTGELYVCQPIAESTFNKLGGQYEV